MLCWAPESGCDWRQVIPCQTLLAHSLLSPVTLGSRTLKLAVWDERGLKKRMLFLILQCLPVLKYGKSGKMRHLLKIAEWESERDSKTKRENAKGNLFDL